MNFNLCVSVLALLCESGYGKFYKQLSGMVLSYIFLFNFNIISWKNKKQYPFCRKVFFKAGVFPPNVNVKDK